MKNKELVCFLLPSPLRPLALAVNKSPAIYILSRGLDGLSSENRGSVNRIVLSKTLNVNASSITLIVVVVVFCFCFLFLLFSFLTGVFSVNFFV